MQQIADMVKQQQSQILHFKQTCDKLIKEQVELKTTIKSQTDIITQLHTTCNIQIQKLKLYGVPSDKCNEPLIEKPSADTADQDNTKPSADTADLV